MRKLVLHITGPFLICLLPLLSAGQQHPTLKNAVLDLQWTKDAAGYRLDSLKVADRSTWYPVANPGGDYTLLFSKEKPDSNPVPLKDKNGKAIEFPESHYRYIIPLWKQVTSPVELNIAGEAIHFLPETVHQVGKNKLQFTRENEKATTTAVWELSTQYAHDVLVTIQIKAKESGYFSIASPALAALNKEQFNWATVPGVFQGNEIEKDFINAFAYGQGIPDKPVVVRERTASTLAPMVTTKENITISVIPEPGAGRDPWEYNEKTNGTWQLGLSVMNRKGDLMPTAYHPVLGEKGSYLNAGDSTSFSFRYTIKKDNWFAVLKHAVNDVYRFNDFLALKQPKNSLTHRLMGMHRYVVNDSLSMWRVENYKGLKIGAQDYLGGVYGSDKDAMKNADYGAMWMLAKITGDQTLNQTRLPYARNFKLMQQHADTGFLQGAAAGQYYLYKSKKFTEEWGDYSEPIGSTFYMLIDIGNVLLFEPGDSALTKELRLAADRLLQWMAPNGQWQVAYDNATHQSLFTDVEDLRPTFYGMLVAYKILGDRKYLAAAERGAEWYINNAVNKGRFLGTCGDARFVPDFATGQSVQALLDLFDLTGKELYKSAAIAAAKIYTASVYTHPIPTNNEKIVNGIKRKDWEIAQAGLSFEHGGTMGSANHRGPILLASHAGMFVRMYSITKESIFLNMARAAALARDAFVDSATSVASYYWDVMNKGAGPYPHHAWWQIGWITDYLLSEIEMRSAGKVCFPRGFIAPKVGPHQTYGFKDGQVNGTRAAMFMKEGLLDIKNPSIDYLAAINKKEKKVFLFVLNNDDQKQQDAAQLQLPEIDGKKVKLVKATLVNQKHKALSGTGKWTLSIPPYGLSLIEVKYK